MAYDIKQSGERIRQLRIQRRYTQEKLAKEMNIDRSLLSHVEAGKRGCSVDLFVQFSEFFGVSLDFLILGKEIVAQDQKQLKSDIAGLIGCLEKFKNKL